MISGTVNANIEAIIELKVVGSGSRERLVGVVVDTGFTGHLTLPASTIAELQLAWLGRERGILADGSETLFDVYRAAVLWDGQPRAVEIQEADEPLLGMALVERHSLQIDATDGGAVTIKALP
jgi:clan AA aspartic protease